MSGQHPDTYDDPVVATAVAACVGRPGDESLRAVLRAELIRAYLPVAEHVARRFTHRGVEDDDLLQIARLGLVAAAGRFDPARGTPFLTYAIPTITGSLRRYFRDHTWPLRMTREMTESYVQVTTATRELTQQLGRAPTAADLAEHLRLPVEEVYQGWQVSTAYHTMSLDREIVAGDEQVTLGDTIAADDADLAHVEIHETLRMLLAGLPNRERTVVILRFFGNMTQDQIAAQLGVSQMHVSRLLRQTLAQLRRQLLDEHPQPDERTPARHLARYRPRPTAASRSATPAAAADAVGNGASAAGAVEVTRTGRAG